MPSTGRLAPSPTGLLHLGHAATFLIAHDRARAAGGALWLRDDDLDPQRSRPDFAAAMRDDLRWLGITWDAEARQSDRLPLYREAMQQLLAGGYAYPCTCSRRDLQQATQAPHEDTDDEPVYSNKCRPHETSPFGNCHPEPTGVPGERSLFAGVESEGSASPVAAQNLQPHFNYRFRIPTTDPIHFTDLHAGPQTFTPGIDFGDFLIWRRAVTGKPEDALPSYQLACAVDDAAMGITEVVRGRDLLKSTARQVLLQRALGLPTPAYFHCDLLRDEHGVRLAKRHDALSLRSLRASGLTPQHVRELALP